MLIMGLAASNLIVLGTLHIWKRNIFEPVTNLCNYFNHILVFYLLV